MGKKSQKEKEKKVFEALPLTELELEFGFASAVDATSGIGRVYHFKQYTLGAELYVDQERFPNAWAYRGKELTRNSKPYKLVKAEFGHAGVLVRHETFGASDSGEVLGYAAQNRPSEKSITWMVVLGSSRVQSDICWVGRG